jgi:Zn-dependent protease with chaperone function
VTPFRRARWADLGRLIVNPLRAQGIDGLFATHPPVQERIARLLSYETTGSAEPRRTAVTA